MPANFPELRSAIPSNWDVRPFNLAEQLGRMLEPMTDEGTSLECGTGNGFADLSPVIGGVEYHIQITTYEPWPGEETKQSV